MADGHFPILISKDADANAIGNPVFVNLSDGTDSIAINADGSLNVTDNGGSLTVDGTVSISGSVTVTATDLDIRDLTHVSDSVSVGDGTDLLAINADGSLNITDNGGSLTVDAVDLDIRDLTLATDAVRVSANTSPNDASNPIYVSFTQAPITGEIHDYNTATVSGHSSSNHDYTVSDTLLLKQVEVASSGGSKVELQVGPVGSLVTKWVGFIPLTGGVCQVKFDPPIEVPDTGTGTVRLIRSNRQGGSQDLYSTIVGIDA